MKTSKLMSKKLPDCPQDTLLPKSFEPFTDVHTIPLGFLQSLINCSLFNNKKAVGGLGVAFSFLEACTGHELQASCRTMSGKCGCGRKPTG